MPLLVCIALTFTQGWPMTKPEKTDYKETSSYADVISFIRELQSNGAPIRLQWTGKSTEGKDMPLAIVAYPPVSDVREAKRAGKPIVYIQANIHAGEVEGKEAAQMLLRRCGQEIAAIQAGKRPANAIVDKLILLVNPIYNIDGNEKWGPGARNRPEQVGPDIVGVRANGQGFDLNRDCIKAESPEMRAALQFVYNDWDPDVIMDLHTTDGTRHGYDLTYSPTMNPNTDPAILKFSRDEMLPTIRKRARSKYKQEWFDYGDASTRNGVTSFSTFACDPRYVTNYSGLRNRFCILSEAATYIPFKDRVIATERFVDECLTYIVERDKDVVRLTREADQKPRPSEIGVRFEMDSRGSEDVILEKPQSPRAKGRPVDLETKKMPVFDRFKVSRTAKFPSAYLISADETELLKLMIRQGVIVEKLDSSWTGAMEKFTISEMVQDASAFQGHKLIRVEGKFDGATETWPAGTLVVRTGQRLGLLAFHLLEPEITDSAISWGFAKASLAVGATHPVRKVFNPISAPTSAVNPAEVPPPGLLLELARKR